MADCIFVVINNGNLGMVRKMQQELYGGRFIATDASYNVPDFKKLAAAFGIKGLRASSPSEAAKAFSEFKTSRGSMIVDYRV